MASVLFVIGAASPLYAQDASPAGRDAEFTPVASEAPAVTPETFRAGPTTGPIPTAETSAVPAEPAPASDLVAPAPAPLAPDREIDALTTELVTPTPPPAGSIRIMPMTAKTLLGEDEASRERAEMLRLLFESSNTILGDTNQMGLVEPLTLEDALRETLKQEPQVKLSEQDVATAVARRQIARGEFDVILTGAASHGETNHEKTPSQIQEIVDDRAERRRDIDENRRQQAELRQAERAVRAGRVPEFDTPNSGTLSVFDSLSSQLQNQLLSDAALGSDAADTLDRLDSQRRGEIADGFRDDLRELEQEERQLLKDSRENGLNTVTTSFETKYNLKLAKKFRNAVRAELGIDFARNGAKGGSPTDNRGKVLFNLIVPLGRGSGQVSAAANERAAIKEVQAAEARLRHRVSERTLETILSYWDLVAAQQEIKILNMSEQLNRTLIQITDEKITAGRSTDLELQLALARYQEILAQRTQAESRLIAARQLLALNTGRSQDTIKPITEFPWATSRFAAPVPMTEIAMLDPKREATAAIGRRHDVVAAIRREESGIITKAAAWRDRLPLFDVSMESFYGVVDEGSQYERLYKLWSSNYVGPSATFKAEWEYAFGNNRAMGSYHERSADLARSQIQTTDLRRQIIGSVLFDIAELTTTLAELKRLDLAYGSYARAHEYEVELFESGSGRSNLMDVVQAEERLTNASRALLEAIRRHVQSIARFNFDTGQILTKGPGPVEINYDNIKTLPVPAAPQVVEATQTSATSAVQSIAPAPVQLPGEPGTPSPANP